MQERYFLSRLVRGAAVAAAAGLVATAVATGGPAGAGGHWELVADGLDNPRGIDLGPGGRLYVAEAGRGGDHIVDVALGPDDGPTCVGMTGAITEIRGGEQRTLIALPSAGSTESGDCNDTGFATTGPHDVTVTGLGTLSIVIGLGGALEDRDVLESVPGGGLFGTAHRVLPNSRNKQIGDLVVYENQVNPDQALPFLGFDDTNPYGVETLEDGSRLVADAGGNSIVKLMPNGRMSTVAIFAPVCMLKLPFLPDIPLCPLGQFPAQPVPTSVLVGPDGHYYVGILGGFPFEPGKSVVYRIDSGFAGTAVCSVLPAAPPQGCEVYAVGLTAVVDIAFGPDGSLYAVQIFDAGVHAGETGGPIDGSIQIIAPGGGAPVDSLGGLVAPGGVAVGEGHLFVTNFSIFPGGGQVVKAPIPD